MINTNEQKPKVTYVVVEPDRAGQRIDNFLVSQLKGVPNSLIYRVLRKGEVRVNKGRVKPDYRLSAGDSVRLPPLRTAPSRDPVGISPRLKRFLESRILWEDDSILVINKPSGLAVHGGSGVSLGLIEALRAMRPDGGFLELVHRLDRDTSGCLMVAKKRSRLRQLHGALRGGGAVEKVYTALLQGRWKGKKHTLDACLSKVTMPSGERVVRVSGSGRQSLTEFTVMDRYDQATLVEARPITGRTHQIRVHAQFAGHAIAGDEKYSKKEGNDRFKQIGLNRLFLHASRLHIPGANGEPGLDIEAPLDAELIDVLGKL